MRRLLATLVTLSIGACTPDYPPYERELYTFGTLVRIELRGLDERRAGAVADRLEQRLSTWNRDWYAWGDGALGAINATLASGTEATTTRELGALLADAAALRDASGGLFDPTVGALVQLWGFAGMPEPTADSPATDAIAAAAAAVPYTIETAERGAIVRTARPGVALDLGGVAKGFALDALRPTLANVGVTVAIVDIGGDVLVIDRDGSADITVGLKSPRGDGAIAYVVARDGEAIVTSGDYERYREGDGERAHHIIDPRTGRSGQGARAVTVIDTRAALADAAATALMVAGPALFHETCRRMGVNYAVMIDAAGNAHTTTALEARLVWLAADGRARDE